VILVHPNSHHTANMSTVTAEALQAKLAHEYEYTDEAEALFFKDIRGSPSFRFETDLGWEFSLGFYIGPDPKGILYYRKDVFGGILKNDTESEAYFYVDQVLNKKKEALTHIKFFAPGPRPDLATAEPLAEFLARDQHNVTGPSGLLRELKTGKWREANTAAGNATVSKVKDSREITITSIPLGKKAVILSNRGDTIYGEAINNIRGRLTVRSLNDLHRGTSVRWYHDYVVFHDGINARDFSAFFFPNEGSSGAHPLGTSDGEKRWTGVVWGST